MKNAWKALTGAMLFVLFAVPMQAQGTPIPPQTIILNPGTNVRGLSAKCQDYSWNCTLLSYEGPTVNKTYAINAATGEFVGTALPRPNNGTGNFGAFVGVLQQGAGGMIGINAAGTGTVTLYNGGTTTNVSAATPGGSGVTTVHGISQSGVVALNTGTQAAVSTDGGATIQVIGTGAGSRARGVLDLNSGETIVLGNNQATAGGPTLAGLFTRNGGSWSFTATFSGSQEFGTLTARSRDWELVAGTVDDLICVGARPGTFNTFVQTCMDLGLGAEVVGVEMGSGKLFGRGGLFGAWTYNVATGTHSQLFKVDGSAYTAIWSYDQFVGADGLWYDIIAGEGSVAFDMRVSETQTSYRPGTPPSEVVPEPSTYALLGTGLLMILGIHKKRGRLLEVVARR